MWNHRPVKIIKESFIERLYRYHNYPSVLILDWPDFGLDIHSVISKYAYRASEQSRPRRDESEE